MDQYISYAVIVGYVKMSKEILKATYIFVMFSFLFNVLEDLWIAVK